MPIAIHPPLLMNDEDLYTLVEPPHWSNEHTIR